MSLERMSAWSILEISVAIRLMLEAVSVMMSVLLPALAATSMSVSIELRSVRSRVASTPADRDDLRPQFVGVGDVLRLVAVVDVRQLLGLRPS